MKYLFNRVLLTAVAAQWVVSFTAFADSDETPADAQSIGRYEGHEVYVDPSVTKPETVLQLRDKKNRWELSPTLEKRWITRVPVGTTIENGELITPEKRALYAAWKHRAEVTQKLTQQLQEERKAEFESWLRLATVGSDKVNVGFLEIFHDVIKDDRSHVVAVGDGDARIEYDQSPDYKERSVRFFNAQAAANKAVDNVVNGFRGEAARIVAQYKVKQQVDFVKYTTEMENVLSEAEKDKEGFDHFVEELGSIKEKSLEATSLADLTAKAISDPQALQTLKKVTALREASRALDQITSDTSLKASEKLKRVAEIEDSLRQAGVDDL